MLLLVASFVAPPAAAHELRPLIATLDVSPDGDFDLTLSLNLEAAIAGIGPEHENTSNSPDAPVYDRLRALDPGALRAAFDPFAAQLRDDVELRFDGDRAALDVSAVRIPEIGDLSLARVSEVVLAGTVPAGAESLTWRLAPVLGDSAIRLRDTESDEILRSLYVRAGETSEPVPLGAAAPPRGWGEVFLDYLEIGYVHIVPKGLDHILFVIGLFLLSTRLSPLLWQVTAFTLAHSVTLALGVTGVVSVSPRIVEPLIAASIVYVAVENIFTTRLHGWRIAVVFAFGLLHGLGFAGVLQEIGLSRGDFVTGLVAFNVGVELGQLTVIAGCFAVLGWSRHRPWYRKAEVIPASLAIAVIAAYWMVERIVAA